MQRAFFYPLPIAGALFPLMLAMAPPLPAQTQALASAVARIAPWLEADAGAAQAQRLAQAAPHNGSIVYFGQSSWLGVSLADLTDVSARQLGLKTPNGALVKMVVPDSPAAKAGIRPGDVITTFRGRAVVGVRQLRRLVRDTPAHRTVAVQIVRQHRARTLHVTLGAFGPGWNPGLHTFSFTMPPVPPIRVKIPPMPPMPPMPPPPRMEFFFSPESQAGRLGLRVETIPAQLAHYFGAAADSALLVQQVRPHSPAARAGFRAGDVILAVGGHNVHDDDSFGTALLEMMNQPAPVTILRARRRMTLKLAPPPGRIQPTGLNGQWAAWAAAEQRWAQKLAQEILSHQGQWQRLEREALREQGQGQRLAQQLRQELGPQLRQLRKQLEQLQKQPWNWQTNGAAGSAAL